MTPLEAPLPAGEAGSLMPEAGTAFDKGLLSIFQRVLPTLGSDVRQALGICMAIVVIAMVVNLLAFSDEKVHRAAVLAGVVCITLTFLDGVGSLIELADSTICELSEYGKLFLPVITMALAAQGAVTASTALYAGTAMFNTFLGSLLTRTVVPLVWCCLILSLSGALTGQKMLLAFKKELKTFVTWCLKTTLTAFTLYLSITGVISGTTDALALKTAKTAFSTFVPVVGGILSDASEAVLVGAGVVKNTVGIYGIFAILTIFLRPFLRIGVHYLLLRLTCSVAAVFSEDAVRELCEDYTGILALLLGLTGAMCLMLFISFLCFLRGSGL